MASCERHWYILSAVLVVACARDASAPFGALPFAAASITPSCGPADGPATQILLSAGESRPAAPTPPFTTIMLWRGADQAAGKTWTIDKSSSSGFAQRCSTSADCTNIDHGTVALGPFASDSSIAVRVDLVFVDSSRLRGETTARWIPRIALCG